MAARPWKISLPTARGVAYVYPTGVTTVHADQHHTTPVIISHGKYGEAQVYLSWEEARSLIGMLPPPWRCTAYSSQCYLRRGTTTPNPHCLACLLGNTCETRREGDFRIALEKPANPLKIPCVVVLCVFPFMWLQFYTSAQNAHQMEESLQIEMRRRQAAERDREALRREKHPAVFRRQAAGAKRVYPVKKGKR